MSGRCRGLLVGPGMLTLAISGGAALIKAGDLKVGVAKVVITPGVTREGRPVWMAGFSTGRRATGIHDELDARAMYIELGDDREATVVLDLIGYFYSLMPMTTPPSLIRDFNVDELPCGAPPLGAWAPSGAGMWAIGAAKPRHCATRSDCELTGSKQINKKGEIPNATT